MSLTKVLENQIAKHKQAYYNGHAQISDEEFDKLEDQLRAIDPDNYMLQKVGYEVTEQKIKHTTPMLSLEKTKDISILKKWMSNHFCLLSEKMDGTAASLLYEKGIFKLAKTRGDGLVGENITPHFQYISFPDKLTLDTWIGKDIEIRGELVISKTNFARLQSEMEQRGLDVPFSMRNIVAGLLHKKSDLDLCKYLTFKAYGLDSLDKAFIQSLKTETTVFSVLTLEGFDTPKSVFAYADDIQACIENYEKEELNKGEYLTDGLVIAIDNRVNQLARGFTNHHPKGKIAFKFSSEKAITKIENILVDVGRTGKISFVAEVTPIELSGALISKVTLHNAKYLKDHEINIGAIIEITRSNEVIPKHVKTINSNGDYVYPVQCPFCASYLRLSDNEVDLYCPNNQCSAQIQGKIENWITLVGIDNLGDSTLLQLINKGLVKNIQDLYKLTVQDLYELDRMGKRSATKLIKNIEASKKIPINVFLSALNIDGLGKGTSKIVAKICPDLAALSALICSPGAESRLMKEEGIGQITADNIVKGLYENDFWALVQELRQLGLEILDYEDAGAKPFSGKNFVITGALSAPRKTIQTGIEAKGGKVSSSVSAKTNYLICNAKESSSSKYKKAVELGIQIITETDLENL